MVIACVQLETTDGILGKLRKNFVRPCVKKLIHCPSKIGIIELARGNGFTKKEFGPVIKNYF
nr:hypothetical protein [uncultured Desulfobacter sp.]